MNTRSKIISRRNHTAVLLSSAACAAILLAPEAAIAQEPGADSESRTDRIIVTAKFREQSLQDVPASISAVTGEDLTDSGIRRIDNFDNQFANVTFNPSTAARSTVITIRGISSNPNNPGIGTAVGVFSDGVFLTRPTSVNTNLFDIERIEVVRGPQGVLYGKNTIAGAVNFITKKPTDEFEAAAAGTYGNLNAYTIDAMANLPLVDDQLAFRISGSYQKRDGLLQNTFRDEKVNSIDEYGFRAAVLWTPAQNVEVLFRGDHSEVDATGGVPDIIDNGAFTGLPFADADPFDREIAFDASSETTRLVTGFSGTVNIDFAAGTLTSISAFRKFDWFNSNDNDYSVLNMIRTGIAEDQDQFSQEVRFVSNDSGPFSYILGGYFLTEDLNADAHGVLGPDLLMLPLEIPFVINADIDNRSLAFFGEASYDLTDALTLTAGLRYSDEKKTVVHQQDGGGVEPSFGPRTLERGDDEVTWSASLTYSVSDDVSTYFSYSTGFKVGGYNVFSIMPANDAEYEPEYVDSYELGLRTQHFDGGLTANLTGFFLKYDDLQVNQLVLVGGLPQFTTSNAAKAESYGLELEVVADLTDYLTAGVNWGYLHSEFTDFQNATPAGDDFTDNRLTQSPKHSVNFFAQGEYPIADGVNLFARGEVTHRSEIFFDFSNDPLLADDSLTLVDARAGIQSDRGHWGLYFWGRNLTDEDYPLSVNNGVIVPGQLTHQLAPPATYGVELVLRR